MSKFLVCVFFLIIASVVSGYEPPSARVRVFHPKGFEVSIPAEPGIEFFAFHGKLNEEFDGLETGRWDRDIPKAKNGRFTFRNRDAEIQLGDTIHFWTYVVYEGLAYREEDAKYEVRRYS